MSTSKPAPGVDLALVEKTVAGGLRLLRFPEALETYFEAETGKTRCQHLVWRGIISLLVYDLFLIADKGVLPDIFPFAVLVRLAVVTPLCAAMLVAIWLKPPVWLREGLVAVGAVMAVGSTHWLMLVSTAPSRPAEHHAIILVMLFVTIVQRLRFPYALAACAVSFLLHLVMVDAVPDPQEPALLSHTIVAGATVLTLVAAYTLERESRLSYLATVRDRLLNRELTALSRHDPLTGLQNRRALEAALSNMEQDDTGQRYLAVLLLDIDHFKLYNDTAGHTAGDVCLKRVAGIICDELPEHGDLAFRFGGEEFLVLLPGLALTAALSIGERVRCAIAEAKIQHPALASEGGMLTASIGVAAAILGEAVSAAEVIAGADVALYAAKRNGRNRVWPPLLNPTPDAVIELPQNARANRPR